MPRCWLLGSLALTAFFSTYEPRSARAQSEYEATARLTRDEFESTRSETIVVREPADRAAAGGVGDALELAPGVVVQRTSSASAAPIVRGLTGNRVLLMLDDLRLNDPLTRPGGHALLNLIDPESVQRIELIRGPASVIYGSDALGGVVHVLTQRTSAQPGRERHAGGTVYGRAASAERGLRIQGAVDGSIGPLGAFVSGGRGHGAEIIRGGGLGRQPFTGFDDWSLASRLDIVPYDDHRFSLMYQSGHLWDVPRTDVSTLEDRQTTESLERDSALITYSGRFREAANLRLRAYGGLVLRREWRQRLREERVDDEREHVLGYQAGVRASVAPISTASAEFGAEAVIEDISSTAARTESGMTMLGRGRYVDGTSYDTYGLYALWSQQLGTEWTALAGVRATLVRAEAPVDPLFTPEIGLARQLDRSLFGVAGSLGVRWDLAPSLTLIASLLSGYRAPNLEDFQALGGGARGYTVPNPDLDDERSWTGEIGTKWHEEYWQLDAFLFASLLTGLIERVPSEFNGMTEIEGMRVQSPENASRSVLLGAEFELRRRFDIGVYGGVTGYATWGETRRPDAGGNFLTEPASKVPPPIFGVLLGYEPNDDWYYVQAALHIALPQGRLSESDTLDVRICEEGPEGCDEEPGWVELGLRAGIELDEHLLLAAGIENIFDTGYKTFASGAYAPGRNFMVGLRGTL